MSKINFLNCDYEITPNLLLFKPPNLPLYLTIGATLKAPTTALLALNPAKDAHQLTVEQYAEIAKIPADSLQTVKQVHSDRAIIYAGGMHQTPPPEADAVIVSGDRGYGGVFIADCLAVVLFSHKGDICAAVHAGWRGALKRIASKTAVRMCELGTKPNELIAVLAAGIGVECYRVGEEMPPLFEAEGHDVDAVFTPRANGWHLDLRQTVAQDLVRMGINPHHIYNSGLCSNSDQDLLWSLRRDGKQSLRNLVFCGWQKTKYECR